MDEAAQLAGRDVRAVTDDVLVSEVRGVDDRGVRVDDGGFRLELCTQRGIPLHELTPRSGSLEEAYMALTEGAVQYKTKEIA